MSQPLQITTTVDFSQETGEISISASALREGFAKALTFAGRGRTYAEAVGELLHDLLARPASAELLPAALQRPRDSTSDIGRYLGEKYPGLKVG